MQHHYVLVRDNGKYDDEYFVYEARSSGKAVQIAPAPFVLVGNHPAEIKDTLEQIMTDIQRHSAVDRKDCTIFHDTLWIDDEDHVVDESFDDIGEFKFGNWDYVGEDEYN